MKEKGLNVVIRNNLSKHKLLGEINKMKEDLYNIEIKLKSKVPVENATLSDILRVMADEIDKNERVLNKLKSINKLVKDINKIV